MLVHRDDYTTSGQFEILLADVSDNMTVSAAFGGLEPVPFPLVHFPHINRTGLSQQLRYLNFGDLVLRHVE